MFVLCGWRFQTWYSRASFMEASTASDPVFVLSWGVG